MKMISKQTVSVKAISELLLIKLEIFQKSLIISRLPKNLLPIITPGKHVIEKFFELMRGGRGIWYQPKASLRESQGLTPIYFVRAHGIGPCTSFLSGKRSTNELSARPISNENLRRVRELNPRIAVLQTAALPLRQRAMHQSAHGWHV